ncbi:MAG: NADH:flavin oxidoreductase, partial [Lentisphaeria bacterium]|nr:NADH:flavin oxidoreductase [Lentisphaeria bacterium]
MNYPRIPSFKTAADFRDHLKEIGVDLEVDDKILSAPESPLAQSRSYHGHKIGNRWCVLPMEGWD